ncbi:MAG: NADPH-dependent glutamate synthase [Planctomycetaceae bacterium]|jgi:glutamate synthase (NADPH/NADH) small chain|nr:NADPH-dependent glutamate synthase [Planctomycetaceae bacterium]
MNNPKEIKNIRIPMPEQPAAVRAKNFLEVPLGYSPDDAVAEASRCIQCKKPGCVEGCPVNVKIPEFLKLLRERNFAAAEQKIKETSSLPAVCGRVCPQETQCEARCILGKKSEPVAVGRCERFVADFVRNGCENTETQSILETKKTELKYPPCLHTAAVKKVAVIGAGPAGLTAAGDLASLGYGVTVFEAFHKPGGVLMYGIPEFRLPKAIVEYEVNKLAERGVKIELNQVIGKTFTIDELLGEENFAAVFISVGAGLPMFLNIPGEDLGGVYAANEFLTRSNLMKAYQFPETDTPIARGKNVCVIGGGNVAMDAARTALRLGSGTVKIIYRRSREELPARSEEVHHAEEEGVRFLFLTNPSAYLDDGHGRVRALLCDKMQLGEPDESGRRRPVMVQDSAFELETDCVIVAAGALANPLLPQSTPGLELTKRGYIVTDEHGRTSRANVWAGGDIVTGSATVILAMGAGKMAANDIHGVLSGK